MFCIFTFSEFPKYGIVHGPPYCAMYEKVLIHCFSSHLGLRTCCISRDFCTSTCRQRHKKLTKFCLFGLTQSAREIAYLPKEEQEGRGYERLRVVRYDPPCLEVWILELSKRPHLHSVYP